MNTFFYERTPFDILVRNFFQDASTYLPLAETKVPHPVDIYTNEVGLIFEIACTGIKKEELKIEAQDNVLRVNYDKDKTDDGDLDYIHRGIAKRSFNLGWKIARRFDLAKIEASMKDGLLKLFIPLTPENKPKSVSIK